MNWFFKSVFIISIFFMSSCSEASNIDEGMKHMDENKTVKTEILMTCDNSAFSIKVSDGNSYEISGVLQTPRPNYSYELISKGQDEQKVWNLDLNLKPSFGKGLAVISDLSINEVLVMDADVLDRIEINISKSFNWGPDKITCVIPYE